VTTSVAGGRSRQKERTREAILDATRGLVEGGGEVTWPLVAAAARVSEATAYRYFPDLVTLLREAVDADWAAPDEVMRPLAGVEDPVRRVGHAAEFLLRGVLARQRAVRVILAAAITRPEAGAKRPGLRFGLIDAALDPVAGAWAASDPAAYGQLKRGLAVVVSAEALFVLTDLVGLGPEEAVASGVATARTLTAAALGLPG